MINPENSLGVSTKILFLDQIMEALRLHDDSAKATECMDFIIECLIQNNQIIPSIRNRVYKEGKPARCLVAGTARWPFDCFSVHDEPPEYIIRKFFSQWKAMKSMYMSVKPNGQECHAWIIFSSYERYLEKLHNMCVDYRIDIYQQLAAIEKFKDWIQQNIKLNADNSGRKFSLPISLTSNDSLNWLSEALEWVEEQVKPKYLDLKVVESDCVLRSDQGVIELPKHLVPKSFDGYYILAQVILTC